MRCLSFEILCRCSGTSPGPESKIYPLLGTRNRRRRNCAPQKGDLGTLSGPLVGAAHQNTMVWCAAPWPPKTCKLVPESRQMSAMRNGVHKNKKTRAEPYRAGTWPTPNWRQKSLLETIPGGVKNEFIFLIRFAVFLFFGSSSDPKNKKILDPKQNPGFHGSGWTRRYIYIYIYTYIMCVYIYIRTDFTRFDF